MSETVHATTVSIAGHGVLLLGRSGAGKSDVALRLIDRGALLVADDYTRLDRDDGRVVASPPAAIRGLVELRGIGIVRMPFVASAPVALAVALDEPAERLPEPGTRLFAGLPIPLVAVAAYEASAAIRIEWALAEALR